MATGVGLAGATYSERLVTTLDYFSDRTRGPRPRTEDEIDDNLWGAVLALLERGIESGLLPETSRSAAKTARASMPVTAMG